VSSTQRSTYFAARADVAFVLRQSVAESETIVNLPTSLMRQAWGVSGFVSDATDRLTLLEPGRFVPGIERSSMLDLDALSAFVRVADLGGISQAARALGAPKSSVSRELANLEASLGIALLERSNRSLRLTDAGRLLHEHAVRILGEIEEAQTSLGNLVATPQGPLRVSAPYAFAVARLAPMLSSFLVRYPQVRVVLDAENRVGDVNARDADVAIRFGRLPNSELVARRLPSVASWLCASSTYLAAHGRPRTVADLARHAIVAHTVSHEWTFDTVGVGVEWVTVKPRAVISDPTVSLPMLQAGVGIGQLPDFVATSALRDKSLVRVLPRSEGPRVDAHALYPSHRSLSPKVRVFLDDLVAYLGVQ
jgi:DNA-binding transcriptional LysR family regulator